MERFIISNRIAASVCAEFGNESIKNVWRGFTFGQSELVAEPTSKQAYSVTVGTSPLPSLPADKEYAYRVTASGIALRGKDYPSLVRGFFDLMMQVEYDADGTLYINGCSRTSGFTFPVRMIHVCAFAQTRLSELKKLIRLAASVGYTHAVLEFWGMFPYECEPRLSWDEAYSKDELIALSAEMRELGIEPVPMINHLGHAASGRITSGKHSVLDRAPELYKYFTPDGWSWDISSPYVRELLEKMRAEQYEVFGAGEYFHLGLDEAYMYAISDKHRAALPEYLSYITDKVAAEGRRPLIWIDMFLPAESGTTHLSTNTNGINQTRAAIDALNRRTVLIDWDYDTQSAPFPSAKYMRDHFDDLDIMCAPWTERNNIKASVETVNSLGLFGLMMTTWHTMAKEIPSVLAAARAFGAAKAPWSDISGASEECATLLRKLSFGGTKTYADAGWCDTEISLSVGEIH